MATYGDMQARIADELGRADLTTQIQNAIKTAIAFYENREWWFQEGSWTINTVIGAEHYPVPADMDSIVEDGTYIIVSGNRYPMKEESYQWIVENIFNTSLVGWPEKFAIFNELIWTYPLADNVYPMVFAGWKRLPELTDPNTSNDWTTTCEGLIRTRAKWDIALHVIRNYDLADRMKAAEMEALKNVEDRNVQQASSGKIKPTLF